MVSGKAPSCLFPTERNGGHGECLSADGWGIYLLRMEKGSLLLVSEWSPPNQILRVTTGKQRRVFPRITTFICPHHGNCFPQTHYSLWVYQHCGAKEAWGSPSTGLFGCPRGVSPVKAWPVFLPHRFLSSLRVCAKENFKLKWLLICIFIWFFLLKIICIWKLSRSLWI